MSDYTELKRLAEAATPGPWLDDDGDIYREEDGTYIIYGHAGQRGVIYEQDANFIVAANPATILALIAENERLTLLAAGQFKAIDRIHCMYGKRLLEITGEPQTVLVPDEEFVKYFEEIKALKAENEELRSNKAFEVSRHSSRLVDQLKAEVEALRKCVEDLALSLECEVNARYAGTQSHPAIKRKYDGDMQEVIDARALIGGEKP